MKNTLVVLSLVLAGSLNAGTLFITNSVTSPGYSIAEMGPYPEYTGSPNWFDSPPLYSVSSFMQDTNTGLYVHWLIPGDEAETFIPYPLDDTQSYGLNLVSPEATPTWQVIPVPEPTSASLFMLGFAMTFCTGMTANAARWVKSLIAGGNNE